MQIITLEKVMVSHTAAIYCPVCQTTTRHVLIESGTVYVCGCGSEVLVEYKEDCTN